MDDLASKLAVNRHLCTQKTVRSPTGPKTKCKNPFVPPVPLAVVKACAAAGCEIVLPLVLAAHRQLAMRHCEWTPLNKAVWTSAGDPPERKREKILRELKARPDLLQFRQRKTATSHYDVALGTLWDEET
jgi:hypothetical protein